MSQPKKILFIDRDGTLIHEPTDNFQVDDLSKLKFIPGVITWLGRVARELDYELVMVTNQDGLGTPSFPEEKFWPAHTLMMETFSSESIVFTDVHIDRSFEHEKLDTRKPGIGMLHKYFSEEYDLVNSFVIGDRLTDVQMAANLGAKAIFFGDKQKIQNLDRHVYLSTTDWKQIYERLRFKNRSIEHSRKTRETDIQIKIDLDGSGESDISTGIAFFDHMLDQVARHGGLNLYLRAKGDLEIDEHHTIEDVAITLGEALKMLLRNKVGMQRYGFVLPMDDCLAQVSIDLGGRSWLVWDAEFKREKIGDMPTEMFLHFFKSLSEAAACNLNIKAEGTNEHHKIEAIFKGFARALKAALHRDIDNNTLPSTKGLI